MSGFSELAQEIKSAPPGGKALMLTAVIAVAGLGLYTASVAKRATASTNGTLIPIDATNGDGGITLPTPTTPVGGGSTPPTHTPVIYKPGGGSGVPPHTPIPVPPKHKPGGGSGVPPHTPVGGIHVPPKPKPKKYVMVQKWVHGGYGEMSSLSAIAQKYYGSAAKWTIIYNANRDKIKNPNLIYAGQQLYLPGL